MDKSQTLKQYLATQGTNIPLPEFLFNMILAGLLAWLLARAYAAYGRSLSNRRDFGRNFVLMTLTTMLVISIVKSSLALSLGLVGALSIVRFRAAIKEPEELSYLFIAIGIGLGLGANQRLLTTAAFVVILAAIRLSAALRGDADERRMLLTLTRSGTARKDLGEIAKTLEGACSAVELKRFDETPDSFEAAFAVEFRSFADLELLRGELQTLDRKLEISLIDPRGLGDAG